MRPGQNKRMRGRNNNNNNNRKGPNPLTRSYESNGPDVKIRGTAHHIGEKYLQLARDAQSSGDPVMAESYLQHAEHYFRLIAAAQQAQQQAAYGYQRPPGEPEQDEDADDDFESLPDRFASPSERAPQHNPAPPQQPPYQQQDRQPYNNGGQQPYEARQNYDRQNQPQPNFPQGDRQPDRQQNYDRQDRTYDNRNGRNDRGDRNDRGQQDRGQPDRSQPDRNNVQGYQGGQHYQGGNGHQGGQNQNNQAQGDRPPRDYDNRNFRNNRGPRDYRDGQPPREPRQPQVDDAPAGGLPAFITGPMRTTVPESSNEQPTVEADVPVQAAPEAGDEAGLHLRPRRRRRPKGEFANASEGGEGRQEPQGAGETTGD